MRKTVVLGVRNSRVAVAALVMGVAGMAALSVMQPEPANAFWPFHKKSKQEDAAAKIQTYQAPHPDAMKLYCEPYRLKMMALAKKHPRFKGLGIKQARLLGKYRECEARVMGQEFQYLKHADIEQAPSLPKLTAPAVDPPKHAAPELQKSAAPESPKGVVPQSVGESNAAGK